MIVNEKADQSEILSPKSEHRPINKFFNKLLSRSFAHKKAPAKPSYIDFSITNQQNFLKRKLEKSFPTYQISPKPRKKSLKSKCLLVPQLKYTHRTIKDSFNFKKEETQKNFQKNPTVSTRIGHKAKQISIPDGQSLISLLRETQRDWKQSKNTPNPVYKNLTIQSFFPNQSLQ